MMAYLDLGVAIVFISAAQIAQKIAAHGVFGNDDPRTLIRRLASSPAVWVAVACLAAGTFFWLLTLIRIEVSKAYPMLSLSFVLTAVFARILLKEKVNRRRWLGVALIAVGASLMVLA